MLRLLGKLCSHRGLSMHRCFLAVLLVAVNSGSASGQEVAATVSEIQRLSDAFETARMTTDLRAATSLVLPDAVAFHANGRDASELLDELKSHAKRGTSDESVEPLRVLARDILVCQDVTAIVTELLGAIAAVPPGRKVVPRRRMQAWAKTSEGWRIAGMHTSPYDVWEESISSYEEIDTTVRYAPGSIVFVGSSSIRGWTTLAEDFADLPVLNRGFGGSQLIDSIMYAHRIVTPYKPAAVAVYAGDNDIAAGKSADRVFADFKTLVQTIHAADPTIRIGFIAIKPSLKRWELWETMNKANTMVAQFAKTHDLVTYLDIATPMLGNGGEPEPGLFVKDGLHLSRSGYDLWTSVLMPWVKNE